MNIPSNWPHTVRVRGEDIGRSTHDQLFRESKAWCEEKFGSRWDAMGHRTGSWCCFWCGPRDPAHYKFHFRNSEDAVLFSLRWS